MDKIMNWYRKVMNAIEGISAVLLALIILVICLQTFCRYVIFKSLSWSEELSRYSFIIMMGWGFSAAIANDNLLRIDMIDKYLTGNIKTFARILYSMLGVFVCGFIVFYLPGIVQIGSYSYSPAMGIKMSHMYLVVGAGFFLALISSFLTMVRYIMEFCANMKGGKQA